MAKIHVSVVQMELKEGDLRANWCVARAALGQAGAAGAELVVLPELWLTGYPYRRLGALAAATPESLGRVGVLAKKWGFFVAGSWAVKGEDGRLYNTACIVGPDGRVSAEYRKVHLFGPLKEDRYFSPGKDVVVASLEIGRVGLALCYDLRFPELARKMALAGAELLVYPSQWPQVRLGHFHALLAARAIENQLFTVGANRAGKNVSILFGGGSTVYDPRGELVGQLGEKAGPLEVDLDLAQVAAVRASISYLNGRVREVDEFLYR